MEPKKKFWCLLGFHKWDTATIRFLAREGAERPKVKRKVCCKCGHVKTKTKMVYIGPP